jgi:hypothetical protein
MASIASRFTWTVRSTGVPVLAGLGQDAHDPEGLVVMLGEGGAAEPVRYHDRVTQPVAERLGHIRTQHGVE